jgi:hypothetical protein
VGIKSISVDLPEGNHTTTGLPVDPKPDASSEEVSGNNERSDFYFKDFIPVLIVLVGLFACCVVVILILVVKGKRVRSGDEVYPKHLALDIGRDDSDQDLSDISQFTKESELRSYSIGSASQVDEGAFTDENDYSIGLDDESSGGTEEESLNSDSEEDRYVGSGQPGSRLTRLGSGLTGPAHVSTSTHRSAFQTEYDLDSPRNNKQSVPQTSTRMARAREQQSNNNDPSASSSTRRTLGSPAARYSPVSTRINKATSSGSGICPHTQ